MSYSAKLRKGDRLLDISSGNYSVGDGFEPPAGEGRALVPINVSGDTGGEISKATKTLESFLALAGDPDEPLYFEWRGDTSVPYEPIYGQWNAARRLEIGKGKLILSPRYATLRNSFLPDCVLDLTVSPHWKGAAQVPAVAAGGIIEDIYGTPDWISRGVISAEATTNKMTNPIWGNSTYGLGWTFGADLNITKNTDRRFILFGKQSIRVTKIGSAASSVAFQSIDVGNTNAHFMSLYVRRLDGGIVTESDIRLVINGSSQTGSTIQALGNGWYRMSKAFTGLASAQTTGFSLSNSAIGTTVYVAGIQVEEKAYPTPLCYGDMLGCSWATTVHQSASSRPAGVLKLIRPKDLINYWEGTLVIVWTPTNNSSLMTGTKYLLQAATTTFGLAWLGASSQWQFSDGTNTITSGATSFTAYTPIVFHLTWSLGSLKLYINGVQAASGSTFTPPAGLLTSAQIGIGTDGGNANHINGTFHGLQGYDRALSAAEVLADYNNLQPVVADRLRVDGIIWEWTKDGDSYTDNCNDSTRDNFRIYGGVGGDMPAETMLDIDGADLSTGAKGGLLLSRVAADYWMPINMSRLYGELSGTVDATASGGEYENKTGVTTSAVTFTGALALSSDLIDVLSGVEIAVLMRLYDALGTGLQTRMYYYFGADAGFYSPWAAIDSAAAWLMRLTKGLGFKDVRRQIEGTDLTFPAGSAVYLQVKRSAGTGDVRGDFYQILTRPWIRVWSNSATMPTRVIYDSKQHQILGLNASTGAMGTDLLYLDGRDRIEIVPDKLNYVVGVVGDVRREIGSAAITDTLRFLTTSDTNRTRITPRWRSI